MTEILTDIETYSEVDIKTCGLYRYASDPSFEILLISWAVNTGNGFGETKIADLARGEPFPAELVRQAIACDLALSNAMTKKAYELTGLENPNSVSQLKKWLKERGIPIETLGKKNVASMIVELDKNGAAQGDVQRRMNIDNTAQRSDNAFVWYCLSFLFICI